MAVSQLGIDQDDAQTATGGMMALLKDQLNDGEFSEVAAAIPGAESLISQFSASNEGDGLLGMASSLLGSSTGGALGGAAAVAGILSKTNLDTDQLSKLGDLFINFLKTHAGDLASAKINDILPALLSKSAA